MNSKNYCIVSGIIFTLVAVLHGLRLALGWSALIGSWSMPMWLSGVGLVIAGFLAYSAFNLGRKSSGGIGDE